MTPPSSITAAASLVRAGRLTCKQLLDDCLAQIRAYDDPVKAWVVVDEERARHRAQELDQAFTEGRYLGPLHGIPIGIKDIFDVAGLPTRAGSPLRAGHCAHGDAPLVAALRRAGAVILGKTVTTQFAGFDPSPTRNPWNLAHTPGGSSSGSAAAVALGMCPAAIGSQTGGSITRPATYCGVAGLKPTFGAVSRRGMVPVSFSLDHPGVLAHRARDLFAVFRAICAPRHMERLPEEFPGPSEDPPRLGRVDGFFSERVDEPVRQLFEAALGELSAAGVRLDAASLPSSFGDVHRHHRCIMAVEAAWYHRETFAAQPGAYGIHLSSLLTEGWARAAVDYAAALRHRSRFRADMKRLLAESDPWIMPATPTPAPASLDTTGDPLFNSPWSYAGFPTVSIPCGLTEDGLPVGLQWVGSPGSELRLLRVAAWCEGVLNFTARPPLMQSSQRT